MTGNTPAPGRAAAGPVAGAEAMSEKQKERHVFWWVFVLVFGTHIFAGFVWLLFYLGGRRM